MLGLRYSQRFTMLPVIPAATNGGLFALSSQPQPRVPYLLIMLAGNYVQWAIGKELDKTPNGQAFIRAYRPSHWVLQPWCSTAIDIFSCNLGRAGRHQSPRSEFYLVLVLTFVPGLNFIIFTSHSPKPNGPAATNQLGLNSALPAMRSVTPQNDA